MMMAQTQTTQEAILIIDENYEIIYKNDFASWLLDENILTITTLKDQTCLQVSSDQFAKTNLPLLLNRVNQLFEMNCNLLSSSSGLKKGNLDSITPSAGSRKEFLRICKRHRKRV